MLNRVERIVCLVALVVATVVTLLARDAPWWGEWDWTLARVGDTTLTAPVTAVVACWTAHQCHTVASITDATPRRGLVAARAASTALLMAWSVLAVTLSVVVVASLVAGAAGPLDPLALVGPVVHLAAFAAAGAFLGWLAPHLVTVALTGPVVFAVAAFGVDDTLLWPLRLTESPTATLAGARWDPRLVALAALALLSLALVSVAAAALVRAEVTWVPATLVALGVVGFVAPALASHPHGLTPFTLSDERASACAGSQPQVCVYPSHQRTLAPLSGALHRAVETLRSDGLIVPDRFVELIAGFPDGAGVLELPDGARTVVTPDLVATSLAVPALCSDSDASRPPPEQIYRVHEALVAWISRSIGGAGTGGAPESRPLTRWLAGPAEEQADWARLTYADLRRCDPDVQVPWVRS